MKILQVIPRFNPKHGGGVNVVSNVSKYMVKKGHRVTIITTDYEFDEEYANSIQKEGVEIIPFRYITNICLFIFSPSMKRWLSKNIKNYDIIHLNGARTYQNNIAYEYARKYSIPYVLQAHGSVLRIIERQRLKKIYDLVWGYRILRESSKVIALSYSEAEAYKTMGVNEDKIEIVPNGIDLSKFSNLPKRGEFRKKYSIQDNEKIVLYLGRLHKSKGINLLIEAFSELTAKLNNAKLILVGSDDRYTKALEKCVEKLRIKDKVVFTGFVYGEEKIMALVDADIFVTPRFYGFPIAFLEAMVCGVPIITTNKGDFIEGINNEIGFVVEYNKEELKKGLFKILIDDNLRKRFKKNAKKKSKSYDWDTIIDRIEVVYNASKGDS